jgi:hypothetical protein
MTVRRRLAVVMFVTMWCAADLAAQGGALLSISHDPNNSFRGVLRLGEALADRELEEAVRSGLPLRVRFRVELWKDGLIDDLRGAEQWTTVLTFDPLSEVYTVRTRSASSTQKEYSDYHNARTAVEGAYLVSLRPAGKGRFYYIASVAIETLSLSDLEELERWLKVSGDRSIPGALGQGARRVFMRVLSLPERRFEVRSARFRLPQ